MREWEHLALLSGRVQTLSAILGQANALSRVAFPLQPQAEALSRTYAPLAKQAATLSQGLAPLRQQAEALSRAVAPLARQVETLSGAMAPLQQLAEVLSRDYAPILRQAQLAQKFATQMQQLERTLLASVHPAGTNNRQALPDSESLVADSTGNTDDSPDALRAKAVSSEPIEVTDETEDPLDVAEALVQKREAGPWLLAISEAAQDALDVLSLRATSGRADDPELKRAQIASFARLKYLLILSIHWITYPGPRRFPEDGA